MACLPKIGIVAWGRTPTESGEESKLGAHYKLNSYEGVPWVVVGQPGRSTNVYKCTERVVSRKRWPGVLGT
jgi:hypothetical protein